MAPDIATLDEVLTGPSDLAEDYVEDVPVPGKSFKIRALSVVASNTITQKAVTTTQGRAGAQFTVDSVKIDILRLVHGVVEPQMNEEQARVVCSRYGPVIQRVLREINRLSGIDEETVSETEARFQGSGNGTDPSATLSPAADGDGEPAVPARGGGVEEHDGD